MDYTYHTRCCKISVDFRKMSYRRVYPHRAFAKLFLFSDDLLLDLYHQFTAGRFSKGMLVFLFNRLPSSVFRLPSSVFRLPSSVQTNSRPPELANP